MKCEVGDIVAWRGYVYGKGSNTLCIGWIWSAASSSDKHFYISLQHDTEGALMFVNSDKIIKRASLIMMRKNNEWRKEAKRKGLI